MLVLTSSAHQTDTYAYPAERSTSMRSPAKSNTRPLAPCENCVGSESLISNLRQAVLDLQQTISAQFTREVFGYVSSV
jgi:hypothetical protein